MANVAAPWAVLSRHGELALALRLAWFYIAVYAFSSFLGFYALVLPRYLYEGLVDFQERLEDEERYQNLPPGEAGEAGTVSNPILIYRPPRPFC